MPSTNTAKPVTAGRPVVTAKDLVATTKALTKALADVERLRGLIEQHEGRVPPLDETPYLEAHQRHQAALADLAEGAGSQNAVDQAAVDLAEAEGPVMEARQAQRQFQAMAAALRPRLAAAQAAAEAAHAAHRVALERHIIDEATAARSAYQAAAEALRDAHTRLRGLQHLARETVDPGSTFVHHNDDILFIPPATPATGGSMDIRVQGEFYSTEANDRRGVYTYENASDAIRAELVKLGVKV